VNYIPADAKRKYLLCSHIDEKRQIKGISRTKFKDRKRFRNAEIKTIHWKNEVSDAFVHKKTNEGRKHQF
jgi:hypothetical protein